MSSSMDGSENNNDLIILPVQEAALVGSPSTPLPVPVTAPEISPLNTSKFVTITRGWHAWYRVLQRIWPYYLATHIAYFILTYLASLFSIGNFTSRTLDPHSMLVAWDRWDTGQFTAIATSGYQKAWQTAFFPLYPWLEHVLALVVHSPLVAGLIISSLATLILLMVLYRLIEEDFDQEHASRVLLYFTIFPTAFFLIAAYNESMFLCFVLLSFYQMRHSRWWLAGLCGFLAALTRSSGLLLLIPYCYEYLRQHNFRLKSIRFNGASCLLIPCAMILFALFCFVRFHDLLAFSHAQRVWGRVLHVPGFGLAVAAKIILREPLLSFSSIHNMLDLLAGLSMLGLVVLCFVGPWKFSRNVLSYALYAASMYFFLTLFPSVGGYPLQSLSRQVIELFPAFIILASFGKRPQFNLYYLTITGGLAGFMLLQFLTGRWIV
jgi:Dolichyl-phosphate-mannose-protein mannosyltransferase